MISKSCDVAAENRWSHVEPVRRQMKSTLCAAHDRDSCRRLCLPELIWNGGLKVTRRRLNCKMLRNTIHHEMEFLSFIHEFCENKSRSGAAHTVTLSTPRPTVLYHFSSNPNFFVSSRVVPCRLFSKAAFQRSLAFFFFFSSA